MPDFSGSYTGKIQTQSMLIVPDVDDHVLAMANIPAVHKSTDPLWNGVPTTYCPTTDTVAGQGTQRGYFINRHAEGDRDYGDFAGKVTTNGTDVTVVGTWRSTGGTGRFAKMKANGTFTGRMISPVEVEVTWDGHYDLG